MAFSLHRTLVNGAVLKTKSEHGRICFFAVEDAFDFTIKFEKIILAEKHLSVLYLHGFFNTFLQINYYLISPLWLNVLVNVEICADCFKNYLFLCLHTDITGFSVF